MKCGELCIFFSVWYEKKNGLSAAECTDAARQSEAGARLRTTRDTNHADDEKDPKITKNPGKFMLYFDILQDAWYNNKNICRTLCCADRTV